MIPGRTFLDERAADLFGWNASGSLLGDQLSGGVIAGEVMEGAGVVALEMIQLTNQSTVLCLNAATVNSMNRAYSAQLASQPGLYECQCGQHGGCTKTRDAKGCAGRRQRSGGSGGDSTGSGRAVHGRCRRALWHSSGRSVPRTGGELRGFADRGSGWRWGGGRCDLRRLSRLCLCGFASAADTGFHRGPVQPGGQCRGGSFQAWPSFIQGRQRGAHLRDPSRLPRSRFRFSCPVVR